MRVTARSKAMRVVAAGASCVALLGVAVFAVPLVWPALVSSWRRVRVSRIYARESVAAAHTRLRGETYVAAIERIRRTIPPGGAYLLVATGDHEDYWVRFDLAPRRPITLGDLKDRLTDVRFQAPPPDAPRWVVVARRVAPGPEIFETNEFFAHVRTE